MAGVSPSSIDQSDINQKMCEEVFTPPWSLEITGLTVNGHGLSSQRGTRPIGIGTYDHVILYSTVVWACILAADGRVMGADDGREGWAIVPLREPLCVQERGTLVVEASVSKGTGRYALQVWGGPPS